MVADENKSAVGLALHELFRELFALHAALSSIMDRVHAEAGLSTPQLKIMHILSQSGPPTVPDMAAQLNLSRQSVQAVCNGLFAQDLLEFRDNPRHKRSRLVDLTQTGRRAYAAARRKEDQIIANYFPEIDPARAKAARELLETIRKAIPISIPE